MIEEGSWASRTLALAAALPVRPLVLGGCCCSHVGAVEALAARHGRVAVVWFDAHGDLNTPETSPSGNEWGMPLRALIDDGTIRAEDVALIGARSLDPPEEEFIDGRRRPPGRASTRPSTGPMWSTSPSTSTCSIPDDEVRMFMPEPGGPSAAEVEEILRSSDRRGEAARRRRLHGRRAAIRPTCRT